MGNDKIYVEIIDVLPNDGIDRKYWSHGWNERSILKDQIKNKLEKRFNNLVFEKKPFSFFKGIILAFYTGDFPIDSSVIEKLFLGDNGLRKVVTESREKFRDYFPDPMIFIGDFPLQGDPDDNPIAAEDEGFLFFDSSIWHRYLYYEVGPGGNFDANLFNLFSEMMEKHEQHIYHSSVAIEYLEFQSRKYLNSFFSGAHQNAVIPFHFHSETESKEIAENLLPQIKDYKWKSLLVDDYANKRLRKKEYRKTDTMENSVADVVNVYNNQSHIPTKREIINDVIKDDIVEIIYPPFPESPEDFLSVTKKKLLEYPKVDFILLDHLLDYDAKVYGTELISNLCQDSDVLRVKPLGGYCILPISSFSDSFGNKLKALQLQNVKDRLHFFDEADPINTTHLFRANLFAMMNEQRKCLEITAGDLVRLISFSFPKEQEVSTERRRSIEHILRKKSFELREKYALVSLVRFEQENAEGTSGKDFSLFESSFQNFQGRSLDSINSYLQKKRLLSSLLKFIEFAYMNNVPTAEEGAIFNNHKNAIKSYCEEYKDEFIKLFELKHQETPEEQKLPESFADSLGSVQNWIQATCSD